MPIVVSPDDSDGSQDEKNRIWHKLPTKPAKFSQKPFNKNHLKGVSESGTESNVEKKSVKGLSTYVSTKTSFDNKMPLEGHGLSGGWTQRKGGWVKSKDSGSFSLSIGRHK